MSSQVCCVLIHLNTHIPPYTHTYKNQMVSCCGSDYNCFPESWFNDRHTPLLFTVTTKHVSTLPNIGVGGNCRQLRSSGVERRVELGCGLTRVFVDSTGISGAKMALLRCDRLCQGLSLSSGEVTRHGLWKGAWCWIRWLSEAGGQVLH